MSIDRLLSIIAIMVSCIAVPASGYLSYRYAIKGEKRKEFNAIADKMRAKLREQIRLIDSNVYPSGDAALIDQEFELFIDVIDKKDRARAMYLYLKYKKTLDECIVFDEFNFSKFVIHPRQSPYNRHH